MWSLSVIAAREAALHTMHTFSHGATALASAFRFWFTVTDYTDSFNPVNRLTGLALHVVRR